MELKEVNPRSSKYNLEIDEYGDEGIEQPLVSQNNG